MIIQHSSREDSWRTPPDIVAMARDAMGSIELDCAATSSNSVGDRFLVDAMTEDWKASTVFVNATGGKQSNKSRTGLFWARMMGQRDNYEQGIFLAFSLEALQVTQKYHRLSLGHFPICIPQQRIRFLRPDGSVGPAPSHSNAIGYIGPRVERFVEVFGKLGLVKP